VLRRTKQQIMVFYTSALHFILKYYGLDSAIHFITRFLFSVFLYLLSSHTNTNTVVPTHIPGADSALCLFNWFKSLQIAFIQWYRDWKREGERQNILQRKGGDAEADQILSSNWISASFHLSSVCKSGLSQSKIFPINRKLPSLPFYFPLILRLQE